SGAAAMAVMRRPGVGGGPAVLGVDSTRLSVVANWREEYASSPDELAAKLRPPAPEPVRAGGALVVVAAAESPDGEPVYLRLHLQSEQTGAGVTGLVGPLAGEPEEYRVDLPGCADRGCRLVGVEPLGPPRSERAVGHGPPQPGTRVRLLELAAPDGTPVGAEALADPSRWRPAVGSRDLGPLIGAVSSAGEDGAGEDGRGAEGR